VLYAANACVIATRNVADMYRMRQRKLAIVLLDLIGSTAFVQKYGALKAAQWFQYHDRLTRNLVYKFNGREIDRSDGFLLSFESAIDAVNFALQYQATIPFKTKIDTRVGIHWGEIIEVEQDELWVGIGAKSVELEGLTKNIAARTMSLCQAGQVLLTKDAHDVVRGRTNMFTPQNTRYACVGLYRFKGVRTPAEIYAVGTDVKYLQPPPGSDKVKRLGGPKYIRLRARDRKIKDWAIWAYNRVAVAALLFGLYAFIRICMSPLTRNLLGLQDFAWLGDAVHYIIDLVMGVVYGKQE
jgi:class 3 adenylate cyclase